MWGIIWILVAAVLAVIAEKNQLKKSWNRKEKTVFFVSLSIGISLSIMWVLSFELANPLEFIADIYRPISNPLSSYIIQFK